MCEKCVELKKKLSENFDRANTSEQKTMDIAKRQTLYNELMAQREECSKGE